MTSLFGEFFLNRLEQDEVWKTRDARVIAVEALEPGHRRNVLRMLEGYGPALYREWVGEFVDDGVSVEKLAAARIGSLDPASGRYRMTGWESWFDAQPLIRRLRELEVSRSSVRAPS